MHTLTRQTIDHTQCPPQAHRLTFDPSIGESGDPDTGQMQCFTCTGPMLRCDTVHQANQHPEHNDYQQVYVHVDAADEGRCPTQEDGFPE